MPMRYSPAFRALMIQKMTDPDGPRPVSLAEDIGVSRSTLYRWVSEADTLDNPFSESLFRTLKYRPEYPSRPFVSEFQAQRWVDAFVHWYNTEHQHSEIRFVTPDDRHYGREAAKLNKRTEIYEQARQRNPGRWTRQTRNWEPIAIVRLNPERKRSPEEGLCEEAA